VYGEFSALHWHLVTIVITHGLLDCDPNQHSNLLTQCSAVSIALGITYCNADRLANQHSRMRNLPTSRAVRHL
jgi:hypothetical protein